MSRRYVAGGRSTSQIIVRLTPDEKAAWLAESSSLRGGLSELVRQAVTALVEEGHGRRRGRDRLLRRLGSRL